MGAPLSLALTRKVLVFSLLMFRPIRAEFSATAVVLSCICWWVWESNARSSAKSRSSSCFHSIHCIPFRRSDVEIFITQSIANRNRIGDSKHPCLTPFSLERRSWGAGHGLLCRSFLHTSSWWCWWSSPGLRSVSAASTGFLCPRCQTPSHSRWSLRRGMSSILRTAPGWLSV